MKLIDFPAIKNRTWRRTLMATLGVFYIPQYVYLGLKSMWFEFKQCWNYQHEEPTNV